MNKNSFKNKKIVKIGFFAVIIMMLIVILAFFPKDNKTDTKESHSNQKETIAKQKIPDKKDPLEKTKKATEYLYRDQIIPIGEKEEYPFEQTNILKNQLLEYAEKGDYKSLLSKGNSMTSKYKFSKGDNLDIAGILYDASTMYAVKDETNREKFGEEINKSTTPEMLIASTMWADNFSRRPVIEDESSLGPVGYDHFNYGEHRIYRNEKEANDEKTFHNRNIPQEIFSIYDDTNAVYAYELTIPNNNGLPLTAYIREDFEGKLHFYGMYAPDDLKHNEQTLAWWEEHDYLFESAENEKEKYYKNNTDGKISKEQVDNLFKQGY